MRSPRSALLLVPMLLVGAMPARAQPRTCQAGAIRLELSATPVAPTELCIHPDQFTTLLFDAPLATGAVKLDGREHFQDVEASSKALVLAPSAQLPPEARLELEVAFADGQVPASARFILVAHPEQAAHQVRVSRALPAANARAAQVQELEERLLQCEAQVARLSAQPSNALGLVYALIGGKLDDNGLTARLITQEELSQRPGEDITLESLHIYRSRTALAVKVRVKNTDPRRPWVLEGATLLGSNGETIQTRALHPATPVPPGASETRWLEWALPPPGDQDKQPPSYTLHLWDEGKARGATVSKLKLP